MTFHVRIGWAWIFLLNWSLTEAQEDAGQTATASNSIPRRLELRIPGLRGNILSSKGEPLATLHTSYDLVLPWPGPAALKGADPLSWAQERFLQASLWLKQPIELGQPELKELYRFQRFRPLVVHNALKEDQVQRFKESRLAREGFQLRETTRRYYPEGDLFAHGLGYLKRTVSVSGGMHRPGHVYEDDYAGVDGLEKVFNSQLQGQNGVARVVTDEAGFCESIQILSPATTGLTVRTTIQLPIQKIVEQSLRSQRAAGAVLLDVHSGDVIAMASCPGFDPNRFIPVLSSTYWQSLSQDKHTPFLSRVDRGRQPPGSIFKVITSLAAMRAGVFDPDRVLDCDGTYQVGDFEFKFPEETKSVNYRDALATSCNTYFIDLGIKSGQAAIARTAREFGVGEKTGFILPGESEGRMPDPVFMQTTHHRDLNEIDLANISIGQGDVLVTPLQAANWMAALANGGTLYKPRLVSGLENERGVVATNFPTTILRKIDLPLEQEFLKKALVEVVEDGTGSAAQVRGVRIAAKTGTAQVGAKGRPRQIAWINGYLPAQEPRYAFAIMLEGDFDQDLHGGTTVGPLLAEIAAQICTKKEKDAMKLEAGGIDPKKTSSRP